MLHLESQRLLLDGVGTVGSSAAIMLAGLEFKGNEYEVSDMFRRFGWIVPAYTIPPDAQHVTALPARRLLTHAH
ncbi:GLUTAMATE DECARBOXYLASE [Salix koriyanagi]|uniref:GLUTAMATE DECARBOXYLASE n=1 Tax=Salix koriyanagi TaxID=2511006 RepID=A0A9Q0VSB4_9ROSI|nr:GLUTAMATE DECARBOXYLASE [Salix koriyanagi]